MNLANKLTLARVFLLPLFLLFFLANFPYSGPISAIIFFVASMTDMLDGYVARKRNQTTKFGKLMDPLADKLLVSTALISLVGKGDVPSWVVIIMIGREFAVTGLRSLALAESVVISANIYGKMKTVFQIIAIIALLIKLPYAIYLLYIAMIMTLISGFYYFYKYNYLINNKNAGGSKK